MAHYTVQLIEPERNRLNGPFDDPVEHRSFVYGTNLDEIVDRLILDGKPNQRVVVYKYGREYVDGWQIGLTSERLEGAT